MKGYFHPRRIEARSDSPCATRILHSLRQSARRWLAIPVVLSAVALVSACGGHDDSNTAPATAQVGCDDSIKTAFKVSSTDVGGDTSVLLVRHFSKGEKLILPNSTLPSSVTPLVASADVCLVKVLVGPGLTSEPQTADSYSKGIGIEVWLPEKSAWNERIRTYGSGGYAGGFHTDITKLGPNAGQGAANQVAAFGNGYVVSHSDHGHVGGTLGNQGGGQGTWAMKADGSPNTVLWEDFSERSLHVESVIVKAMTKLYYGKVQKFAYWDGFSTGGRQGYKLIQKFPTDYDGYLVGAPAFNWSKLLLGENYAQVAMQNDLGHVIASRKINFASGRAVTTCDTLKLGLLTDPYSCQYDPAKDATTLCAGVRGENVVGTNADASSCMTLAEAKTLNKIWYGWTRDGSAPDPAVDNGNGVAVAANQLWYGNTRGTNLTGVNVAGVLPTAPGLSLASAAGPLTLSTDFLALALQIPAYGYSNFTNATGNGQSKYLTLTYSAFANAYDQALVENTQYFSYINTDDPDLTAARNAGVKVLHYHGLADEVIFSQGSVNYYNRAASAMGGISQLQNFDRLYLIPGLAHDSTLSRAGQINPTTLGIIDGNTIPLPQGSVGRDELFKAMSNWVENGAAPGRIELSSGDGKQTLPICVYPQKATYKGTGPVTSSASYDCL
ncbi:tannase/feruloyl esterase family alpha/beta hydrolase [Caballeronia sp. J97]|uniref:tannase/feruloyl esterase family alpha/beta hydrolase n=1 Tax=Caballeronia sp. J97 TaxID=2805429 RepID=UPI002AB02B07|nr:tannase/feruloyl esterase family alpha/beta hydrolase [Caballeronia sp. J97]